jgi:integrase
VPGAPLHRHADRPPDAYCFSPYEVRAEWCLARGRRAEFGEGRRPGDCYTTQSLDRCVRRAVRRAGVARWTPNMLRHLVATVVEVERGREDARVVMGHATPTTTSIYAEQVERAARVMAEMG